jgi:Mrp family chromosome partitioning ATPase
VVVVTRAGQTPRKAVAIVLAMLARMRANTLGIVLNEVTQDSGDGYRYYTSYARYDGKANLRAWSGT